MLTQFLKRIFTFNLAFGVPALYLKNALIYEPCESRLFLPTTS